MTFKYFKDSEIVGLDLGLVQMLDKAREFAGIPFIITSGLRTIKKNAEVGGAPNSAHLSGKAVDLQCRNSRERFLITQALLYTGFTRIGNEKDHIHADIDISKDVNVIWQ